MKSRIRERRQAKFIDQAENLFFEKGYSKTSISDICKEIRCSRTTLYTYFESKENIYLAVVNKSFMKFLRHFDQLTIRADTGIDRVLQLVRAYLAFSRAWPRHYQMILDFHGILRKISDAELQVSEYALLEQCSYFEEVKKHAKIPLERMIREIEQGQQDGSISTSSLSQTHFINLWAYLIGITHLYHSSNARPVTPVFDSEVPQWERNVLTVVRLLLAS